VEARKHAGQRFGLPSAGTTVAAREGKLREQIGARQNEANSKNRIVEKHSDLFCFQRYCTTAPTRTEQT